MRAAVRPETTGETRTQSGERLAVRPKETEKVSSDRPTARPAAIEVGGDSHESQSDALAEEMYRAVQARSSAHVPAMEPTREAAQTVVQSPFTQIEPAPAPPAAIAATIPDSPEPVEHDLHDDDVALRVRRTRLAVVLVTATTILAVIAWFAGRYVGVLLQH